MEVSHVSVLAEECIQALNLRPDGVYVDGTTGGGGHSLRIAQQLGPAGRLICIDRDEEALAAAIVQQREESPIETTGQLAQVIREAMPAAARREKQHPAKRSFQAIRIEVNGELRAVEQAMEGSVDKLLPGGRLAVISFHSLEDRIVKKIFAQQAKGCTCPPEFPVCVCGKKPRLKLISRGVITAGQKELDENPRARSAKLRVAERI